MISPFIDGKTTSVLSRNVKEKVKATSFRYLLSAYQYDVTKNGLSYSLPLEDVQQLFANFVRITILEENKIEIDDGPMTKFVDEEVAVNEVTYFFNSIDLVLLNASVIGDMIPQNELFLSNINGQI